jgi:hypothetical protein
MEYFDKKRYFNFKPASHKTNSCETKQEWLLFWRRSAADQNQSGLNLQWFDPPQAGAVVTRFQTQSHSPTPREHLETLKSTDYKHLGPEIPGAEHKLRPTPVGVAAIHKRLQNQLEDT